MIPRPQTALLLAPALVLAAAAGARAGLQDDLDRAAEDLRAWDVSHAAEVLGKAQESNPSDPRVVFLVGHLRLMEGRYAEAVEYLSQAVLLGAGGTAEHYLGLAKATLAETKDYEEHLTSGGHFLVRHAPGPDEVMVPYADEVLEAAWKRLVPLFGYEPPTPVRVEIYPKVEVLGAVSSLTVDEIRTSGTIALCKYDRLMITSPRDLVYGYGWADTLSHEFIHLLVTRKSRNTVPIWLHEGLAKYFEGTWRDGVVPELERHSEHLLAEALSKGSLISFEAMSPSMAKLPSQDATATAFAEVFTVVEFLVKRGGETAAPKLVELMAAGKDDREAVSDVAGIPWARFEPAWKAHLQRRGLRKADGEFDVRLLFKGRDTEATELEQLKGEKARGFVWLGDRLAVSDRWRAAAKEYRKAAAEVGDGTPVVQAKLGRALLEIGDPTEAAKALRVPLPVYPDYMLLRVYLGRALLGTGQTAEAREHLEHAIRINPFDPEVHGHLARAYEALGMKELAAREARAQERVGRP